MAKGRRGQTRRFPLRFRGSGEWREPQEEENLDLWSLFCEQGGEVTRGDDASGLVTGEHQQVTRSLEQLDRGEFLAHEEVGARIDEMFRKTDVPHLRCYTSFIYHAPSAYALG